MVGNIISLNIRYTIYDDDDDDDDCEDDDDDDDDDVDAFYRLLSYIH